jgi:sugar phosphate permease
MGLSHAALPTSTQVLIGAFGWRGAWIGLAVMIWLLVLLPALFLVRERPEELGLRPDGDVSRDDPSHRQASEPRAEWTLGRAARTSAFWILMATGVTQSMVGTGIIFHQVSYFSEQGLLDHLALVFAIFAVAQTTSMTLTGVVLDRIRPHFVLTGLQLCFTASIVLMLVLAATPAVVPLYAALMGIGMGGVGTFGNVTWPTFFGTRHLATIRSVDSGVKMTAAAIGPLPLAVAFDYLGGYSTGLVLFALLTGASALAGLACRPPSARSRPLHQPTAGTP